MVKQHFLLFVFLALSALANGQDQSGFISIDCGIPDNSSYTDGTTGIIYVSDVNYIDTGVSINISPLYKTNDLVQQFHNVRSFPQGIKNCYILTPAQLKYRSRYFVRASFMYGNYDNKNQVPKFDLYLGVNYWVTVEFTDASTPMNVEILHVPSANYTHLCLVNTGHGTPFISVLELRLVDDGIYKTESGSLELLGRFDLRSYDNKEIIRYEDDIFDRIWSRSFFQYEVSELNTSINLGSDYQNIYRLPSVVMSTAITPQNASNPIKFYWVPTEPTAEYLIYMHFADFQSSQSREFSITVNEDVWYGPFQPYYLETSTIFSLKPQLATARVDFSLVKTENSTLPPILNAFEIYTLKQFSTRESDQEDVNAIKEIKATYRVKKNWQGDPCTPKAYSWEGLDCFNASFIDPPRIISLNLSSSGLTGKISPSIFNLKMLQYLDLSYNSLTGKVPDFLSQMRKLTVLKLTGNNLTGTVPAILLDRSKKGLLSLSVEGNPNLCKSDQCEIKPKEKTTIKPKEKSTIKNTIKNNMVILIVALLAVVVVIVVVVVICCCWCCYCCCFKRRNATQQQVGSAPTPPHRTNMETPNATEITEAVAQSDISQTPSKPKQKQFTYEEVLKMTEQFKKILGEGGFGKVYQGTLEDNTQVAVKMLSKTSTQGKKQFKNEVELLMNAKHRNLTSLLGYCYEGDHKGLIYEYMANRDLRRQLQLSEKNKKFLGWQTRLEIAIDAAQGLEHLHTKCTPPIIHRDVKSANILLNGEYQAKLGDFGLSKAFPTAEGRRAPTSFVGTNGYFDPEKNSDKTSDVFSFGVVLLEIITGKPAISTIGEKTQLLTAWVDQTLKRKWDVTLVVDPRLGNFYGLDSASKAVRVAMDCGAALSSKRPTINQVVLELKQCLGMEKARSNQSTSYYDTYGTSSRNTDTNATSSQPSGRY